MSHTQILQRYKWFLEGRDVAEDDQRLVDLCYKEPIKLCEDCRLSVGMTDLMDIDRHNKINVALGFTKDNCLWKNYTNKNCSHKLRINTINIWFDIIIMQQFTYAP